MSLFVLRGFQFLIPLITLPYLVRTLGIENFGLVNFALSLGHYFGAIIQFGFSITATREVARYQEDQIKVSKIFCATMGASILLALISALLFSLIVIGFDKFNQHLNLYFFVLAYILFQNLFPIWFFQGMEKMKFITFLNLGSSALFLIGLIVFVEQKDDFYIVPLLQALASLLSLILALVLIKKEFNLRFITPSYLDIRNIYKNGYHAFVAQLAPNLYNNTSVFLLGIYTNNNTVGLYTAATKVIDAVISFAYILSNTFLPHLARNLKNHKKFQKIMLAFGLTLTIATFIYAEFISQLLFSKDYVEVSNYIKLLAICILFLFITMTYGTNYLMLINKDKVLRNIVLLTSICFFLIALFVVPIFGILGSISVLVGARATLAISQFSYYQKYKNLN